jgi:hypothetical protein
MRLTTIIGSTILVATACGSSSNESAPGGSQTCGVAFSWTKDAATCQGWMERYCCNQTRACSNEMTCSSWVKCINACPVPRQDACIIACGTKPISLDDVSACTKQTPPAVATPLSCEWP